MLSQEELGVRIENLDLQNLEGWQIQRVIDAAFKELQRRSAKRALGKIVGSRKRHKTSLK